MRELSDTIAAVATPRGVGGIGIVRVSGPNALAIAEKLTGRGVGEWEPQRATVCEVFALDDREVPLDQAVVTYFRGPRSYTGEDVVEIACHGGLLVVRRVLEECLRAGARLAEPGEFTRRAFLNGKLDLTQVEAVAGIVHARSEAGLRAAVRQLQGNLSRPLRELRNDLLEIATRVELELDFAEEDVELAPREEIRARVVRARDVVRRGLASYSRGRRLWEGVRVVIAGRPNVGKSSLLNALVGAERAIVTEVPGTTRDTIEAELSLNGVLFRLVDTAGLRQAADKVEVLGIDRTWREVERADVVLWVIDASAGLEEAVGEEGEALKRGAASCGADLIVVLNKVDLEPRIEPGQLRPHVGGLRVVEVSAKTGAGLGALESALLETVEGKDDAGGQEWLVTSERQFQALVRAGEALDRCLACLDRGYGYEVVAVELREAMEAVGSVVGEVTTEDILNEIFARFCIGK
ncbi:MAG: tRNA uridine-5-carboxymethylaminomethyl(34) synthesis GTPase MnmE [candidate division KSB1 bacterium]|nr:tRNA uridine-5-carboxymethylaminomethyl(34) synthesis GTPase MnmE [candidate division KSB1 bacterium]